MQPAYDVCDTSRIYNSDYNFSLPKPMLEGWLSGKAFDNRSTYTPEEADKLRADINDLSQSILAKNPVKEKLAIMTAGAPGSGKTTQLKKDRAVRAAEGKTIAYICPDDVCLKAQTRTYLADIAAGDQSKETRQAAYNKWRPGSNASAHLILGNLIRDQYAFYFGTTSTGKDTWRFFEFLQKQGYHIRLIHLSAPDAVRWGSIQERDKTFVQTTEEDVRTKGLLLPERINDTFLKYADEIEFYYRGGVHEDAVHTATWLRKDNIQHLIIIDPLSYGQIKSIHNAMVEKLKRPELAWEKTVELNHFPADAKAP